MKRLVRSRFARARWPNESGAAAVEFALVLPLLLLLLFGSVDWGYYFFVEQVVTNAAREGARNGAVNAGTAVNPCTNAQPAAQTAAGNYLTRAGLPASGTVTTACPTISGALSVQVTVHYPVGSITGFLPAPTLVPAYAHSVAAMRIE